MPARRSGKISPGPLFHQPISIIIGTTAVRNGITAWHRNRTGERCVRRQPAEPCRQRL